MATRSAAELLTSVDSIFTTQEERDNAQRSYVTDLPTAEISDFPNHPFKVRMDESMTELADSVKERGVLSPVAADPHEPNQTEGVPAKSQILWGEEEQGSGANSARQDRVSRADFVTTSYPTAVTRSNDGEIRKMYDLGPEDGPAGIPRSDIEQEGYHYTLIDLLKQELPANESRQHTETVSVPSQSKDMGAVLALLPQTKEFITEDGLTGTLTLKLGTVNVEVAGYGSSTKSLTAARTYPALAD